MRTFLTLLPLASGAAAALWGCGSNPLARTYQTARDECLVPCNELLSTGQGKDGVPPIVEPAMVSSTAQGASYLVDSDRVLGIDAGSYAAAYPLRVLNYHQVVNDVAAPGGLLLLVTYDPLTRAGMCHDARPTGAYFGTSGLVYNSNLIVYDRVQNGDWSQMRSQAVRGPRKAQTLPEEGAIESTWGLWKAMYPGTRVLAGFGGAIFNYTVNPHAEYEASPHLRYPVSRTSGALPAKEHVFGFHPGGVLGDVNVVYAVSHLRVNPVVNDRVGQTDVLVLYDQASDTAVAYERPPVPPGFAANCSPTGSLCFSRAPSPPCVGETFGALVLTDDETDSVWNLKGECVCGAQAGTRLRRIETLSRCYWFAWYAFWPDPRIV